LHVPFMNPNSERFSSSSSRNVCSQSRAKCGSESATEANAEQAAPDTFSAKWTPKLAPIYNMLSEACLRTKTMRTTAPRQSWCPRIDVFIFCKSIVWELVLNSTDYITSSNGLVTNSCWRTPGVRGWAIFFYGRLVILVW